VGAPLAGLKKKSKRGGETKKSFWGKYYNFLGIPNYTEGLFVCSNHAQENTI
jgi:hypothetical protein